MDAARRLRLRECIAGLRHLRDRVACRLGACEAEAQADGGWGVSDLCNDPARWYRCQATCAARGQPLRLAWSFSRDERTLLATGNSVITAGGFSTE